MERHSHEGGILAVLTRKDVLLGPNKTSVRARGWLGDRITVAAAHILGLSDGQSRSVQIDMGCSRMLGDITAPADVCPAL